MNTIPQISMEADHVRRRLKTVWRGVFSMADIAASCQERENEGAHGYDQLIDATGAEIAHSPEDVGKLPSVTRDLADRSKELGLFGRTAVVVGSMLDYGTCRRIASYFEEGGEIAVYYNEREARQWLKWAQ